MSAQSSTCSAAGVQSHGFGTAVDMQIVTNDNVLHDTWNRYLAKSDMAVRATRNRRGRAEPVPIFVTMRPFTILCSCVLWEASPGINDLTHCNVDNGPRLIETQLAPLFSYGKATSEQLRQATEAAAG
jgi:hypothetical protein